MMLSLCTEEFSIFIFIYLFIYFRPQWVHTQTEH